MKYPIIIIEVFITNNIQHNNLLIQIILLIKNQYSSQKTAKKK